MKTCARKFIVSVLAVVMLIVSSQASLAQNKLFGNLTVIKNGASVSGADNYVLVNGERALTGGSILSPSEITSPAPMSAKISLAKTGDVLLSWGSSMKLSFADSNISGELLNGTVTVKSEPNTALALFTKEGTIIFPVQNQANAVTVSVDNGKTIVNALQGQVKFNNVLISAGESYPGNIVNGAIPDNNSQTNDDDDDEISTYLIIGIIAAAAGAAIIAFTVASGDDDNDNTVSPIR